MTEMVTTVALETVEEIEVLEEHAAREMVLRVTAVRLEVGAAVAMQDMGAETMAAVL